MANVQEVNSPISLGARIRLARLNKHLGLRELARQLDMAPSYLSDIENDRRTPAESVLRALAAVLDQSLDELMALGGRIGDEAERYVRTTPAAALLLRRLSEGPTDERLLREWLKELDQRRDAPKRPRGSGEGAVP